MNRLLIQRAALLFSTVASPASDAIENRSNSSTAPGGGEIGIENRRDPMNFPIGFPSRTFCG